MGIFRRRPAGTDANEIATHAVKQSGGSRTAAVVSALALVFSGFSLWETSLKQADLSVYATGVVNYERDGTADEYIMPAGGFEVFAVPITIANSGARDAAVLGLQLDVKNPKTGLSARFEATYTADAAYFAVSDNPRARARTPRAKTPFSALVVAGRSAWTGTVLFYPVSYSNGKALTPVRKVAEFNDAMRKKYAKEVVESSGGPVTLSRTVMPDDFPERAERDAYYAKVLNQNDKVEATLKVITPAPSGWLDRALRRSVKPITLRLDMPDIPGDRVERGELVRLRPAASGS
jgi:hypothetical protein